jgi:membrane fusion protein, multidrug efflux system
MKSPLSSASLLLLALLAGCARHEAPAGAAPLPPAKVRTAAVEAVSLPQLTEVTGTIRPARHAMLAAKVMGSVAELPVALGQPVRAGDLLLRISAAEINAKVAQARSQLNLAGRDLERERDLLAKGASTDEMVRSLEDRYTMTEAMVHEAETMLGYTEIRAPFDGVVAHKFINAGDLAGPGQPLLEVEGTTDFEIEAGIPESLAAGLVPGTSLTAEAAGAALTGSVRELSSTADAATRTVGVKIALTAGPTVRSGQFARVFVPGPAESVLLIPTAALSPSGQLERVFVAGDNRQAVLRLVKSGARRGDQVEVLSGLSAGEKVVLNPPAGLREGQTLEAQP